MGPRSIGWVACITVLLAGGCQSFSEATTPDAGASDAGGDSASGGSEGGGSDGGGSGDGGSDGGPCGAGVALGTVGTLFGKVNVHTPKTSLDDPANLLRAINGWLPDPDCASGADLEKVGYCRRFWPDTSDVVAGTVTPDNKPFLPAGCSPLGPLPGQAEYVCCKR
jgi:hypothetical protein